MPHQATFLGTGQVCADVNGDGRLDLFLTSHGGNRLWLQQDHGGFSPATTDQSLRLPEGRSSGTLAFDYDNDGWTDLLVLSDGPDRLFRNLDGEGWLDVSMSAGVTSDHRSQSAAVADFDGNGWLDVYIVRWYPDSGESSQDSEDVLYQNFGGHFVDVSGLLDPSSRRAGPGFAATWGDFDNDGDPDLYVVNDKHFGNPMWRNDGPGCDGWCFSEVSLSNGANRPAWSMGVASGDYDRDGDLDFYYSSIGEMVLLRNELPQPLYTEQTQPAHVNVAAIGWGVEFLDADNDGWLDLALATMNTDPALGNRLFQNLRDGTFADASTASGFADMSPTIGLARCDLDDDGRIDLVLGDFQQQYRLLRNTSDAGGFLSVKLTGGAGVHLDAIGTRAWLIDSAGGIQMQEVRNGSSIGGGSETGLHFGLGTALASELRVRWPDGTMSRHAIEPTARRVQISLGQEMLLRSGFE